jgi:hypothetical protein
MSHETREPRSYLAQHAQLVAAAGGGIRVGSDGANN